MTTTKRQLRQNATIFRELHIVARNQMKIKAKNTPLTRKIKHATNLRHARARTHKKIYPLAKKKKPSHNRNMSGKRTSTYTPEEKSKIMSEISDRLIGGESLREICADDNMPSRIAILRWRNEPEYDGQYTRARELQADGYADDINDIANRVQRGEIDPSAAKVAIEGKKWAAGKLRRGMYGDAAQVDVAQTVTYNVSDQDRALLNRYLAIKGGAPDGGRIENYGNEIIDAQGATGAVPCDRLHQQVD